MSRVSQKPIRLVALVACCKEKAASAAPARELYRSPLFRLSLAYAERVLGAETYILSAQHGLVDLGQVLEPYDLSQLGAHEDPSPDSLDAWDGEGEEPSHDMEWVLLTPHLRVILLAGELYNPGGFLARYIEQPMAGMQIGERLQWLRLEADRASALTAVMDLPRSKRRAAATTTEAARR